MAWKRESGHVGATANARVHARRMRRDMTPAEQQLWWALRNRLALDGSHFRRQFAIGPYITDFCCLQARLIVEVDGDQHGFDRNRERDGARDAFLVSQGFRVIRFTNADVMREIDSVLDTILATLSATTPTPGPSPQGGGET